MTAAQSKNSARPGKGRQTLPWTALVAVLIAITNLGMSFGFTYLLPLLAVALLPSYFVSFRITMPWMHWLVRFGVYGLIVSPDMGSLISDPIFLMSEGILQIFCEICLAELVLQCWIKQQDTGSLGVVIFLTGLVFLLGCTTRNDLQIRLLAPAYILFAILSFPCFRPVAFARSAPWTSTVALRSVAILIALLVGACIYGSFWTYRDQLTDFGDNFMQNRRIPEQAGVSANPVLGDSYGSVGSPARVLRIVGPVGDSHLRGLSFDTYDLGAWRGGLYGVPFSKASPQDLRANAPGPRAQFTCLADSDGIIYLPLSSAGVDAQMSGSIVSWAHASGSGIRTTAVPPYQYTVIAGPSNISQGPFCAAPSPLYRQRDLVVPSTVDPSVRKLALRIGGKLKTPQDKINAVTNYLLSHYTYSLTIHPGPGDPVSNFLLHRKSAYCEYFASAAAILLRYLGVPTRYVVGYYAHESEGRNVTVVRQWDAHAWAESWVDGLGWVTVDATPGNGRPDQINHSIPFWTRAWEWLQDESAALRAELSHLSAAQIAKIVCGVGLTALFISWLWRQGWRAWIRRRVKQKVFGYSTRDQDLERMAARFDGYLARSGLRCESDQTWGECLQKAASEDTSVGQSIDIEIAMAFIDEYNSARFGEAGDAETLNEKLSELEGSKR